MPFTWCSLIVKIYVMKNKGPARIFFALILVFFIIIVLLIAVQFFIKKQQFKNYDSQRMSAFESLVDEVDTTELGNFQEILMKYPLVGYSSYSYDERMGDVVLTEDGRVSNISMIAISSGKFRKQNLYNFNGAYVGQATIGKFYVLNRESSLLLVDVVLGIEVADENGVKVDMLQPLHELVVLSEGTDYSENAFYELLGDSTIIWKLSLFDRTDTFVGIPGYKEMFMKIFKPSDLDTLHKFAAGEINALDTPPVFLFTMTNKSDNAGEFTE